MADTKISGLIDGGTLTAGDQIPVNRGGANRRVTVSANSIGYKLIGVDTTAAAQDILGVQPVDLGGTGVTTTAAAKDVFGYMTDLVDDTTPQLGGNLDSQQREIHNFVNNIKTIEATAAYTFVSADTGTIVSFDVAGTAVATLPGTLPIGWTCNVYQASAGEVQFATVEGATLKNRQGHTKINGSAAAVSLTVLSNAGSAAAVFMLGDTV